MEAWESFYSPAPNSSNWQIMNIPIHLNETIPDRMIWASSSQGTYSTKEGYRWLIRNRTPSGLDFSWSWIWHMKAPENIRFLIWLACHGAAPTLALLFDGHISLSSDVCPRCNASRETFLHAVRDCKCSFDMWLSLGFGYQDYFQLGLIDWIKEGIRDPREDVFLAGLWWIWRGRNHHLLAATRIERYQFLFRVNDLAANIRKCFHSDVAPHKQQRWVQWHPSLDPVAVLNVDGSCLGNPGRAGYGGLLRTSEGAWVFGFFGFAGFSSIVYAELLAICRGLQMAWDSGVRHLVCYTDSRTAFDLVLHASMDLHPLAAINY